MYRMNRHHDDPASPFAGRFDPRLLPLAAVALPALAGPLEVAAEENELPFSAVRVIIETNATDCDAGLQFFFDGEPWQRVRVEDPHDRAVLVVRPRGSLADFGLTEQFNETNEPVMAELVDGAPELGCDEAESTLVDLYDKFPAGEYGFEGVTTEGEELDGEAVLSHVIPAPPVILSPSPDMPSDPENTVVSWEKVEALIATFPDVFAPAGITDDDVEIAAFQVIVQRLEVGGESAVLDVFTSALPGDLTEVTLPAEVMDADAAYKFEVLQIDRSGNQTIAESEFETF